MCESSASVENEQFEIYKVTKSMPLAAANVLVAALKTYNASRKNIPIAISSGVNEWYDSSFTWKERANVDMQIGRLEINVNKTVGDHCSVGVVVVSLPEYPERLFQAITTLRKMCKNADAFNRTMSTAAPNTMTKPI
jgi:hypothetical protein